MDDTDLAGPLVFCLAFGGFLLLVSIWFWHTLVPEVFFSHKETKEKKVARLVAGDVNLFIMLR